MTPKIKSFCLFSFFLMLFIFSFWVMFKTFGYDEQKSQILIATKVWSDFGANLPLIRSFSFGNNIPPEYPIFPGEPIRYHFLFYLLVGLLEKIGLRLDLALNIPSALSFFGLIILIYLLAKTLFKSRFVAFLSIIFFLFNGSFSFFEFFKKYPPSLLIPKTLWELRDFSSFMPYGQGEIAAFWSLNIFTNQRHLALSFFLILLIIYLLVKNLDKNQNLNLKQILFLGFILGLFPSLHKAVFLMAYLILFCFFLFFRKLRLSILIMGFFSLFLVIPQLILTNQLIGADRNIVFYPGYLVANQGLNAFFRHWIMNLGLHFILIPLGFLLAPKPAKKVFLGFFSLFIVANLFKFSPEVAANHKFFNLFMIIGNMFSARAVVWLWHKKIVGKIIAPLFIFFLIFSGIIDLFPIKNDVYSRLDDAPGNSDVVWIKKNTLPKSVFLNTSYFYHPANLAGRKIYYGWPYFAWSAGYATETRYAIMLALFQERNVANLCRGLEKNKIDYIAIERQPDIEEIKIDMPFWQTNFVSSYQNPKTGLQIYQTEALCLSH